MWKCDHVVYSVHTASISLLCDIGIHKCKLYCYGVLYFFVNAVLLLNFAQVNNYYHHTDVCNIKVVIKRHICASTTACSAVADL